MAGSNSDFDLAAFEAGIRLAMDAATPNAVADRAKFYFPKVHSGTVISGDGVPLAVDQTQAFTQKPAVMVPCAVEPEQVADQATRLGIARPNRIRVTLLEDDYRQVEGCAYVVVGGERFDYRDTDPPQGLFNANVWTMWFTRSDV